MMGDNRSETDALARNPSRLEQMSLYSKYILPRVIDLAMKNPETRRLREVWIPQAEGEVLEVRGDGRTWAETEYRPERVDRVHFRLEVLFGADFPPVANHEVVSATRSLVNITGSVVEG